MSYSGMQKTCFGTIRNNIALKLLIVGLATTTSFGTIRNNIALKLQSVLEMLWVSFGTIRNNIALKPLLLQYI